jgi:hypothetical protein|tara:strand:+ start:424 stop:717 length:294 start_codon:yes stop_codon:yes gene_type:complete
MKNKKAQISTFIIVTILAFIVGVVITGIWIYDISTKECKSNADCGKSNYCGGDHACHIIPIIQESSDVDIIQNNYGIAGFILGISIIISSLIIKPKK